MFTTMRLNLLLASLLFATLACSATETTESDEKGQLSLADGERVLMSYNAAYVPSPIEDRPEYGRSGFIHPVYSPKGNVVTDAFPSDHPHQHGLMFAWTSASYEGQKIDFWNSPKKQGIIEHVKTLRADEDVIQVQLRHVITIGKYAGTAVLNETWTITRVPHETLNIFDLVSVQTCATDKPLKILKYNYGGMCIRSHDEWNDSVQMLTSEGKSRIEGNHTRPSWVALFGEADAKQGNWAGIAAMSHPDNFRGPQPARLHGKVAYFCFAPMVAGEFQIKPGEPYTSKFRFVTYDGKPDINLLNTVWKDYAKDIE